MNRLRSMGWLASVAALALLGGPSLGQVQDSPISGQSFDTPAEQQSQDYTSTDSWWQDHLARMKRIDSLLTDWFNMGTPPATTVAETLSDGTTRFHRTPIAYKEIIGSWPDGPKSEVQLLVDKYGYPDEVSDSQIVWNYTGPWKRTVVYRDVVSNDFPKTHDVYIEQVIDCKVPPKQVERLTRFDKSMTVDSTNGELLVRGNNEEMNFLAMNLANDILTRKRSVKKARDYYSQTAADYDRGMKSDYTQSLQFKVQNGETMGIDSSEKP
jgi:hypothetical protein